MQGLADRLKPDYSLSMLKTDMFYTMRHMELLYWSSSLFKAYGVSGELRGCYIDAVKAKVRAFHA